MLDCRTRIYRVTQRRAIIGLIRSLSLLTVFMFLGIWHAGHANAHNLPYTLVEVEPIERHSVEVRIFTHVGAYVLDLPLEHLDASGRNFLSDLSEEALAEKISVAEQKLEQAIYIVVNGEIVTDLSVNLPPAQQIRSDTLTSEQRSNLSEPIRIVVPIAEASNLIFAGPYEFGRVVLITKIKGVDQAVIGLGPAEVSPEISLTERPSWSDTVSTFVAEGVLHIIPLGLDHVLFILSLVFIQVRARDLFLQVTGFTIAHSITLGLIVANAIPSAPEIIEPLIAVSIVVMALHNLTRPKATAFRTTVVVGLGLLHGLGFASALQELGLPQGQEIQALIAFNIGVEIGQVFVLSSALLLTFWMARKPWFYLRVAAPISACIAITGSYWTLDRIGIIH